MEIIIAYILGILTVFLIGMAVGMFMVFRKNQRLQNEINKINLELNSASMDLYRSIETSRAEVDKIISDIYREVENKEERFIRHVDNEIINVNKSIDSRLNKLENKFIIPSDSTKTLLRG